MHVLVVNNFVEHEKMVFWIEALRHAIHDELGWSMEVVRYTDFLPDFVERNQDKFDAAILSGSEALFSRDSVKFRNAIETVRVLHLPVLGICAGLQLIALACNGRVVNMGQSLEGYYEVEVLGKDPLFDGLPQNIFVRQSHEEMIERVPRGFTLLAKSRETPIEAMKGAHADRIAYGVQFHPELHDEDHPAGRSILENFARIARQ